MGLLPAVTFNFLSAHQIFLTRSSGVSRSNAASESKLAVWFAGLCHDELQWWKTSSRPFNTQRSLTVDQTLLTVSKQLLNGITCSNISLHDTWGIACWNPPSDTQTHRYDQSDEELHWHVNIPQEALSFLSLPTQRTIHPSSPLSLFLAPSLFLAHAQLSAAPDTALIQPAIYLFSTSTDK